MDGNEVLTPVQAEIRKLIRAPLRNGGRPVRIGDRDDLTFLSRELGLGSYWHEPDEQDVDARVFGHHLDNAGYWGLSEFAYIGHQELHTVIYYRGVPIAAVNLATLLGWAAEG